MKICEHYILGELTGELYCNARDCIYRIEPKRRRILPDCDKMGNADGPCLDEEVSNITDEGIAHIISSADGKFDEPCLDKNIRTNLTDVDIKHLLSGL